MKATIWRQSGQAGGLQGLVFGPETNRLTLLGLRLYPNQVFTILIWGSDRGKFGNPERDYSRKNICVTGAIQEYRGAAEIVARNPSQITVR